MFLIKKLNGEIRRLKKLHSKSFIFLMVGNDESYSEN